MKFADVAAFIGCLLAIATGIFSLMRIWMNITR